MARLFVCVLMLTVGLASQPARAGGANACAKPLEESFAPAAPSFDCKLAKTLAERAMCADEALARLDLALNLAYQRRQSTLPPGRRLKFYTDELSWVRKRDLTCTMKDTFGLKRCLTEITISRIGEIASYGK